MEFDLANNLSKKLQININNIVREYWEVFMLNALSLSPLGEALVFKGGTALRLIYNSPRFSEDLDFSLSKRINFRQFKQVIEKAAAHQVELSIKEIQLKRYTYFALIKFKQDYLAQTLSIKIEVSKRKQLLKAGKDFQLSTASSATSNLKPLVRVFTLQRMFKDKLQALSSRSKARDLFDAWFIEQLLQRRGMQQKARLPKIKMPKQSVKQELHRLLPKNYYLVIPELIKYGKIK